MTVNRKVLATAALIAAFTFVWSAPARAQAGSGLPSTATFLSAVNSADDEVKALAAEKSITPNDVHVVAVSQITNQGNSGAIARAIAKNAGPIGEMREALRKYPAIMSKLAAAGVSVSQVVALDVKQGDEIHIFYQ
jgi:hypothetical protein